MIVVDDVTYAYRRAKAPVLDRFTASFPSGAVTAVTGANGSGKTTLAKLMVGIERPQTGRILVDEVDTHALSLAEIGRRVGYVYQNPARQLFCTSVIEEVSYGLRNHGLSPAAVEERALRYLEYFGLADHATDFPLHLSHGEMQRLMLAAILSLRPAYVILDEPTTGLDVPGRRILGAYLRRLAEDDGCGVIVVSHERGFVSRYADAEVRMGDLGRTA